MTTQRSRRAFLAGTAASLGGCTALAMGQRASGVSVLAAGSLNDALETGLRPSVDRPLYVEAHGSARVARLVAEGQKEPDIVSLSDVALFDAPLHPPWHATFATNAIVLAYDPDSRAGQRVADADRWYRPLLAGEVRLGRTDPDLDPLGYRTLFVLDLASDYYHDAPDLRAAIPGRRQVFPETQLLSQFETGAIDAAFTYRSMAVSRGYEYVDLPTAVDLSDPDRAEAYAATSYRLPNGKRVEGGPIRYGATIRTDSQPVRSVFEQHVEGSYLREFGFEVPANYPIYTEDAPAALRA